MTIFYYADQIGISKLPEQHDRRCPVDREQTKASLAGDPRVAMRSTRRRRFLTVGRCAGVQASQKLPLRETAATTMSLVILEDDCVSLPGTASRSIDRDWEHFCVVTREAIRMTLSIVPSKVLLL